MSSISYMNPNWTTKRMCSILDIGHKDSCTGIAELSQGARDVVHVEKGSNDFARYSQMKRAWPHMNCF